MTDALKMKNKDPRRMRSKTAKITNQFSTDDLFWISSSVRSASNLSYQLESVSHRPGSKDLIFAWSSALYRVMVNESTLAVSVSVSLVVEVASGRRTEVTFSL